jgi:hypothetical protein
VGLLASLLPGFRDLRTPMSSGLLWLGVLVVTFADDLHRLFVSDHRTSTIAGLIRQWPTPLAVPVALATAYLLGHRPDGDRRSSRWTSADSPTRPGRPWSTSAPSTRTSPSRPPNDFTSRPGPVDLAGNLSWWDGWSAARPRTLNSYWVAEEVLDQSATPLSPLPEREAPERDR